MAFGFAAQSRNARRFVIVRTQTGDVPVTLDGYQWPGVEADVTASEQQRHDRPGRVAVVHGSLDSGAARRLAGRLRLEALTPTTYDLSKSVIDRLVGEQPDAVVVVVDRAHFDLARLCRDLRSVVDSGIVVAVARSGTEPARIEIELLDAGADATVSLTVQGPVLAARIRASIRSRPRRADADSTIALGDTMIDVAAHSLVVAGREVPVRQVQFRLLLVLARNVGTLMTQERLLREVWNIDFDRAALRRLRIAVSGLRRILGEGAGRPRIESIARLGYRLVVPNTPLVT
jgi:two-component system KDP operon response regulator KdpE